MDYNKIGKFIMSERKSKKITQAKLAEKLFISEKTVSKWENGNGIPDTSLLPKLCDILGVSINEILNGERIVEEKYMDKAEEKLLELEKEKQQSDRRLLIGEVILGFIFTISFLVILFSAVYIEEKLNLVALPIIMIVVGFILFILGMTICLYIEQKAGYYICKHCKHKHVPTFKQVVFAMHVFRIRYIKCPHCKKRSWQRKIIK